jgi:hypothetical protein
MVVASKMLLNGNVGGSRRVEEGCIEGWGHFENVFFKM